MITPMQARRVLAFAVIVALHAAGLLWWPKREQATPGAMPAVDVVFVAPPKAAPPRQLPAPRTATALQRTRERRPMQLVVPQAVASPSPAPVPVPIEQAPAVAQTSADDVRRQARLDVGKIDRDMRAASLDMAERHLALNLSKRERGIADAFVERGPPKIVEEVMSDGRRRSRIGNSCAYMESNGLVGARDVFKNGVKTRWERC